MDSDAQMEREHERQEVIRTAVQKADRILMHATEGVDLERATIELFTQLSWLMNHHDHMKRKEWEFETPSYVQDAIKAIIFEIDNAFTDSDRAIKRYLYFEVTLEFAQKARAPFIRELNVWDLENPAVSS